jgi:hypothetical protein
MEWIIIWVGIAVILALLVMSSFIFLIFVAKKTHAIIEFKSSMQGNPISLFFQDNRYCEWKVSVPDAGMIEDKQYGQFVVDQTYIDKKTKNVLIPFNSTYATSLNVKAAKMADDLTYMFKEKDHRKKLKYGLLQGVIQESEGIDTLRTSINFSSIKHFVPPLLPHNIQSKIVNQVQLRLADKGSGNLPNIILLAISAIGAMVLSGLVLRFVVFK